MTEDKDILRETLIAALWEGHEGAVSEEDRWSFEDIATDILDSNPGRDLRLELEQGRKAQAVLRLVVMRHHGPDDITGCDVCSEAMAIWGTRPS